MGKTASYTQQEIQKKISQRLDQDIFEANIRHMAGHCRKRQVAAGAIGLCCSTISEAEWMSADGIRGLLWTTQRG